MNNTHTLFRDALKVKHQECSVIYCLEDISDYDPYETVTTELGYSKFHDSPVYASIQKSELSPTGEMKFNLLYGPKENGFSPIPETNIVTITQDTDCLTLRAVLTKIMDVVGGLDVTFNQAVYDNLGALKCSSLETWHFNVGMVSDLLIIVPCTLLLDGYCIEYTLFATSDGSWDVVFDEDITNCDCP
jgi:hypothetical protein